ncbi:MAG: putative endonuclease [Actinomycetota bacterium]|jgi:putative endonuclease|nr:putative endonuclease [Actinomycetota bacterium]
MRAQDGLGRYGENVAASHLVAAGLTILERNWRCDIGEIDIVARDGDVLVVCEVKTRSGLGFGAPLEAVSPRKAARLRRLAARWLDERAVHPGQIRVDLVGVLQTGRGAAEVEYVRGV